MKYKNRNNRELERKRCTKPPDKYKEIFERNAVLKRKKTEKKKTVLKESQRRKKRRKLKLKYVHLQEKYSKKYRELKAIRFIRREFDLGS